MLQAALTCGRSVLRAAYTCCRSVMQEAHTIGWSVLRGAHTCGRSVLQAAHTSGWGVLQAALTSGRSVLRAAYTCGRSVLQLLPRGTAACAQSLDGRGAKLWPAWNVLYSRWPMCHAIYAPEQCVCKLIVELLHLHLHKAAEQNPRHRILQCWQPMIDS